jgi:hypothetical protein
MAATSGKLLADNLQDKLWMLWHSKHTNSGQMSVLLYVYPDTHSVYLLIHLAPLCCDHAGAAPFFMSERAMEKLQSRKSKPATFNLDMNLIGDYWGWYGKRSYHHTGPVSTFYASECWTTHCGVLSPALHEALAIGTVTGSWCCLLLPFDA